MYFKLAWRNMQRNLRQYAVYFMTLVFGVVLCYAFNSLGDQSVLSQIQGQNAEIFRTLSQVIFFVSIFLVLLLASLLVYANQYMLQHRAQEFSLYLSLGMSRWRLNCLLCLENIFLASFAFVVGLTLGVFSSYILILLTNQCFAFAHLHFQFHFSRTAFWQTLLLYLLIFAFILLFTIVQLSRLQIIDLMKKKQAALRRKKLPLWGYCLLFVVSLVFLSYADYQALHVDAVILDGYQINRLLSLGALALFLFFASLSPLLLFVVQKMKRLYFKNMNVFVFRNLNANMTASVFSLFLTCMLMFISFCTLVGGFTFSRLFTKQIDFATQYQASIESGVNAQTFLQKHHIDLNHYAKKVVPLTLYENKKYRSQMFVTAEGQKKLGAQVYDFKENLPVTFVSLEDVNASLALINKKPLSLATKHYTVISNETLVQQNFISRSIRLQGVDLQYDQKMHTNIALHNSAVAIPGESLVLVVPKKLLVRMTPTYYFINLSLKNAQAEQQLSQKIAHSSFPGSIDIAQEVRNASTGLGMMAAYLGIYVGLVFLLAAAMLLAIQQLVRSEQNQACYRTLKSIGATDKQIYRSLRFEFFLYFITPFLLALEQTCFTFPYIQTGAKAFGVSGIQLYLASTFGVVFLIYMLYFAVTYYSLRQKVEKL